MFSKKKTLVCGSSHNQQNWADAVTVVPPASANMLPLAGPKRKGLILHPVVSANMLPPLGVDKSDTELTVITH